MISARDVGIVAQRELMRNLRSTKGIAMFALFFLGGLLPAVIRLMARKLAGDTPEAVGQALFEGYLGKRFSSETTVHYLSNAPQTIYFLFEGTLTFLPLLVLVVGFDQIAGEIQHRTLRYSAGRATRPSLVLGKAIGIWGVVAVMISVLHITVWVVALIQGGQGASAGAVVSWGARVLLFSVVGASAYVGFASLMSSLFRTPIVVLFVGAGVGFAIWLSNKILGFFPSTEKITWIFPNRYEQLLFEPDALTVLGGIGLFIAWGALCIAASSLIVSRRDV
jgi:ABC-type transport system involved in multi-copper enzyme maturation permease subunit